MTPHPTWSNSIIKKHLIMPHQNSSNLPSFHLVIPHDISWYLITSHHTLSSQVVLHQSIYLKPAALNFTKTHCTFSNDIMIHYTWAYCTFQASSPFIIKIQSCFNIPQLLYCRLRFSPDSKASSYHDHTSQKTRLPAESAQLNPVPSKVEHPGKWSWIQRPGSCDVTYPRYVRRQF